MKKILTIVFCGGFILGLNLIVNFNSSQDVIFRRARRNLKPTLIYDLPGISISNTAETPEWINAQLQLFINTYKQGFKLLPYQDTKSIMSVGQENISLAELVEKARTMGIKTLIWCGIGGQGNGNKAVHNTFPGSNVDVIILDNLEGSLIEQTLKNLDPATTMLAVSSKSFTTTETMGNAGAVVTWMKEKGLSNDEILDRLIINSDNIARANEVCQKEFGRNPNYLFRISVASGTIGVVRKNADSVDAEGNKLTAEQRVVLYGNVLEPNPGESVDDAIARVQGEYGEDYEVFEMIHDIGGRYSVLIAGVISGAIAGIDVDKMLQGAREAEEVMGKLDDNKAAELAFLTAAAFRSGKDILVIVPTSDRLRALAEWINQHNGESGGKEGRGQYPLVTVVSSNEELKSLYASADDKMFLFLHDEQDGFTPSVPDGVDYVQYSFPVVSEENVGMFFQFFNEWAVRFPLALGINPIVQPWVDAAKKGFFKLGEGSPFAGVSRDEISVDFSKSGLTERQLRLRSNLIMGAGSVTVEELVQNAIRPSTYQEIAAQFAGNLPQSDDFKRGLEEGYKSYNLKNIAAQIARAAYLLKTTKGCKLLNSLFYTRRLKDFGDWIDSIARERNLPIYGLQSSKLVASLNQHDLLQWMGDGPPIAFVMGVIPLQKDSGVVISDTAFSKDSEVGRDMGEIYDWMWESISSALEASGRPTATLFVPELNDYYYGQLFALYDMTFQVYKAAQLLRLGRAYLLKDNRRGSEDLFSIKSSSANQLTIDFAYRYDQLHDETWGQHDQMFYNLAALKNVTIFRSSGEWDYDDPDRGMFGVYPAKEVVLQGNHVRGYNYNKDNDIFEVYVTPEFYQQVIAVFGKDVFNAGIEYGDNKDATIIHKLVFRKSL